MMISPRAASNCLTVGLLQILLFWKGETAAFLTFQRQRVQSPAPRRVAGQIIIQSSPSSEAFSISSYESVSSIFSHSVAGISRGGSDPNRPSKVNQDAFFLEPLWISSNNNTNGALQNATITTNTDDITSNDNSSYFMAGVMDGHGKKGHLLTQYLAKELPACIQRQWNHHHHPYSKSSHNTNTQQHGHRDDQSEDESSWKDLEEQLLSLAHWNTSHAIQQSIQTAMKMIMNTSMTTDSSSSIQESDNKHVQQYLTHAHTALIHAFHEAQWKAMQEPTVPAGRSGTTATVVVWNDKWIHVASVGDSAVYEYTTTDDDDGRKACLLNQQYDTSADGTTSQSTGAISSSCRPLSKMTTVSACPDERFRIEQGEGRIDGQDNVWYGPVGIAMTRALGNAVMLRAGVVPTPVVHSYRCSPIPLEKNDDDKQQSSHHQTATGEENGPHNLPNTTLLVLATDGVWDVVPPAQISDLVLGSSENEDDAHVMAKDIASLAENGWKSDLPLAEDAVDDITVVVARL